MRIAGQAPAEAVEAGALGFAFAVRLALQTFKR